MTNKNEIVFTFPAGIPGFEEYTEFILKVEEENNSLGHLTAVKDPEVGFVILKPGLFFPDYLKEIELDQESIKTLKATSETTLDVWVILTLNHQDISKTTVSLRAPLVLNAKEQSGAQIILSDERYLSRQPLFGNIETSKLKGAAG